MTEFFEEITVEINQTTWVDVTSDVLIDPAPRGSIGISDNGFLDRVANTGKFEFSLDNTGGYYSTGAGADLIAKGGKVRVGFKYGGRKRYKWFGYIAIGGGKVIPGNLGPRRVDIECIDWFGLMSGYPLDFLDYATNKRIDEAAPLVLAELPAAITPTYTEYYTGDYTFPDVFDIMRGETTVMGEFNKLAVSEFGLIYSKGNEWDGLTLVVENKLRRFNVSSNTSIPKTDSETTDRLLLANGTDFLLLANGTDFFLLVELQTVSFDSGDISLNGKASFSRDRLFANYIKASVTPRRVDAAATTVLWTMEGAVLVTAGNSISNIRGRYRDPGGGASYVNGLEMVTPVATTDYRAFANADGTGTEYTANCSVTAVFGSAEVEISITNTGANDFYVGGRDGSAIFQVRGKGVYTYDTIDVIIDTPITGVGRKLLTFDMAYATDPVEAKRVITLSVFKDATGSVRTCESFPLSANRDKTNMMAFMYLEPGTRATFAETVTGYNAASFINGYDFEINEGKYVEWRPVLVPYSVVPIS